MSTDERESLRRQAARRFTLSDAEKARRLGDVKARLTVEAPPPAAAPTGGWLWPALFWTAFFALGSAALSHWLAASTGRRAVEVRNGAALELRLGRSGNYEVAGWVASRPARFIVDTGASLTSIPPSLGERIGIRECPAIGFDLSSTSEPGCCRRETFHTANGPAEGCVARVPSLRFGAFEVRNAQVAVMPGSGDTALLGMNVLKHFSLVQQGGRLTVSAAPLH